MLETFNLKDEGYIDLYKNAEYDIKMEFKEGKNVITFTPDEEKEVVYSSICGMLSNKITIYE